MYIHFKGTSTSKKKRAKKKHVEKKDGPVILWLRRDLRLDNSNRFKFRGFFQNCEYKYEILDILYLKIL